MIVVPEEKKEPDEHTVNEYIPEELLKMLELPFGYSLLIKGEGGVGKSTLALELLVRSKLKASFLSTRIAPEQIFKHFPWITNASSGNIAVLDATQAGTTMDNPLVGAQIALKFSNIPEFLKILLEDVETTKESHFYVIDSWDAIQLLFEHNQALKTVERPQLTENLNFMYNAFMSNARKNNIKIVLVAENASTMDYLVDAIVELKRTIMPNNKIVRTIEFKKCRGVRIANTSYIFTLEEGRFRAFAPWNLDMTNRFTPDPVILKFKESNLQLLFKSIMTSTAPLQTGVISIDVAHPEILDIWIENLARLQVCNDEIFLLLPPDGFDFKKFEVKVKEYMKRNKIEDNRFFNNIMIICLNSKEEKLKQRQCFNLLPSSESETLDIREIEKNIMNVTGHLVDFYKGKKPGRPIMLAHVPAFTSKKKHPVDYQMLLYNILQALDGIQLVIVGTVPSSDANSGELLKVTNFYVDTSFVSGSPLINFVAPQLPNLYGLLKKTQEKDDGEITFDVYPIM